MAPRRMGGFVSGPVERNNFHTQPRCQGLRLNPLYFSIDPSSGRTLGQLNFLLSLLLPVSCTAQPGASFLKCICIDYILNIVHMQDHPDAVESCPCCAELNWQAGAEEDDGGRAAAGD